MRKWKRKSYIFLKATCGRKKWSVRVPNYSESLQDALELLNELWEHFENFKLTQKKKLRKKPRCIVLHYQTTRGSLFKVDRESCCCAFLLRMRIIQIVLLLLLVYSPEFSFMPWWTWQLRLFSRMTPERFKTRAAHFPIESDGRTGMQRGTLGKSGSEASSQLQGRIARAFFSNSFGKYHGYDGCNSIYFDSSTIVRLSGLI